MMMKEIKIRIVVKTCSSSRDDTAYYEDLECEETVTIVTSGTGLDRLLANTETGSNDYNTVKALVAGELNTFMGFKFETIGARRLEGGLGGSGLIAYAWAPNAVGLASASLSSGVSVDWIPERTSWLSNGILKAGSCIIDPEGTARIAFV